MESLEKCGSDPAQGEASGAAAKSVERISTAIAEVCHLIVCIGIGSWVCGICSHAAASLANNYDAAESHVNARTGAYGNLNTVLLEVGKSSI